MLIKIQVYLLFILISIPLERNYGDHYGTMLAVEAQLSLPFHDALVRIEIYFVTETINFVTIEFFFVINEIKIFTNELHFVTHEINVFTNEKYYVMGEF